MSSRLAGFGSNTTRPAPRRMPRASIAHRRYTPSPGSETRPATSCQSSRSEPTTEARDATNAPQRPRLRRRAAGIQQPPRSSPGGDHPAADGSGLESSAVGAAVALGQDHLDPAGDVVDQVEQQREQHRHDRPDDHTQQAEHDVPAEHLAGRERHREVEVASELGDLLEDTHVDQHEPDDREDQQPDQHQAQVEQQRELQYRPGIEPTERQAGAPVGGGRGGRPRRHRARRHLGVLAGHGYSSSLTTGATAATRTAFAPSRMIRTPWVARPARRISFTLVRMTCPLSVLRNTPSSSCTTMAPARTPRASVSSAVLTPWMPRPLRWYCSSGVRLPKPASVTTSRLA